MGRRTKPRNFSLIGILKLTRFWNLLIIVMAQYFAAIFLIGENDEWPKYFYDPRLFFLSLSTVLIAAAGYIINDYYDIKIDYVNKPDRVVVGRLLKRRVALFYHSAINFFGVLIGLWLSWYIGLINLLAAACLWLYSNQLKRMPLVGNLVVAFLTALSIAVVNVLYAQNNTLVWVYTIFSFSFTLVREVIKDIEDVKGDKIYGCRTLPIVWGIRKTKNLLYLLLIFFFITVMAFLFSFSQGMIRYYFTGLLLIPLVYILFRLMRADTQREYYWLSQFCKVVMLCGIVSMTFI